MKSPIYSVSQLAKISGISIRRLHLYDEIGLLKPMSRTESGYREYGKAELFRLQQILLYKELNFPLASIKQLLDDPDFDLLHALENQKLAFQQRQQELMDMLKTIDQTIQHLKKQGIMTNLEFLYNGIPKETAEAHRKEATEKWGEDSVEKSEGYLVKQGKAHFEKLKKEAAGIGQALFDLRYDDPTDPQVQSLIAQHYANIRAFWGTVGSADLQADAYEGLGKLYKADERYLIYQGKPQPAFAEFMCQAMAYFAERSLR